MSGIVVSRRGWSGEARPGEARRGLARRGTAGMDAKF
nr:MAG TPA: hypothetical protein [Caudoviricetes sp.]